MKTIQASINTRLLKKADRLFTGTLAGRIIEILQNARRAGATRVEISNRGGQVTVLDNGGGIAGQFGHITVAADGPMCKCGRRGCVETLSSGTALGRLVTGEDLPAGTLAAELLARAEAGDPVASAILADWAEPMRRALETLVAVADPKLIVIGGGLGAEMAAALARLPAGQGWFGLPIAAARLGDDAGVIGAGLAAPAREDRARTA